VGVVTTRLSKLHGTGNDFLVTVALDGSAPLGAAEARALCDRHRGIGADGVITLLPGSDGADCTMELRNADGAVAEMSGNGVRCLAWVAHREGLGRPHQLVVDTGGGRRTVSTMFDDGDADVATVDMGPVTFEPKKIPLDAPSAFDLEATFHGVTYRGDAAGIGNPHLVLFVDDVDAARVLQHGPRLEHDERFPNRTNVEFVQVLGRDHLRLRVWERGVGETLSCGTGVSAAAAVAHRRGVVDEKVTVDVPGGTHVVELGESVRLGGDVRHVFDVDVDVPALVGSLA
jgi:diaminopimelate epimerase